MSCVLNDSLPNAVNWRYGDVSALETVGYAKMCRITSSQLKLETHVISMYLLT